MASPTRGEANVHACGFSGVFAVSSATRSVASAPPRLWPHTTIGKRRIKIGCKTAGDRVRDVGGEGARRLRALLLARGHGAEGVVDIEEALGDVSAVGNLGERHQIPVQVIPPFGGRGGAAHRDHRGLGVTAPAMNP